MRPILTPTRSSLSLSIGFLVLLAIVSLLLCHASNYLVMNAPRLSNVIVVLAGETHDRPDRALQLLAQGYARRMILDVPAATQIYNFSQIDLARQYIRDLPEAAAISICPITGLSTKEEAKDVERCLGAERPTSILLVTSDFHTRRAFTIFWHEIPEVQFSVAAARNDTSFGIDWWKHREWAKTFFEEWLRLAWWSCIDRWR